VSISESYTERLDKDLRAITAPLMEQLKDIDGEIAGMVKELAELRTHRTKLVAIVRSIDPELVPKKVYPAKSKSLVPVSEEMVEAVFTWLQQNVNGDEFYASGLMARDDFNVTSASQLSKAINVLHERGQIRLVRSGSGGSKHYKVVT
jgi:hypothetical protein